MSQTNKVLFVLLLILVFSASSVLAQEKTRLALSVRNVVLLPFYYAKDRQIFEKHGLYVEIVQMRSDLQMAGVASGELDFAAAVGSGIQAIISGMPLKIVGILYHGSPFSLVAAISHRVLRSWKGRKSWFRGSVLKAQSGCVDAGKERRRCQEGDLYSDWKHTVSMIALQQTSVDAAVLSPPFTGEMVVKGFKILQRSRGLFEVPSNGLVTSRDKIQKQPQKITNVLKAMLESLRLIRQDRPAVVEYIRKNFSVAQPVAQEAYDDLIGVMLPDMIWPEDKFKAFLDSGYVRTESSKAISVGDIADYSLLRALK